MNSLISICIPTYERPDLLRQAIESCLNQTYKPIEIIIGDDSIDDKSEAVVQSFDLPNIIRYVRNSPSLKQANNVNKLFDLARGERLVLLHDDDLLLPTAIAEMNACWEIEPDLTACFGKQYIINMQGSILEDQSYKLNRDYYRTEQYAGLQASALWSALVGQFPNDGYMIVTAAAKQIRYLSTLDVGDACDYEFGLRLATTYKHFFFLNHYTALYRLTDTSVLRGNNYSHLTYRLIKSIQLPEDLEPFQSKRLREYASPAINKWLALGNKHEAYSIYRTRYYPWSKRISLVGLVQALLLILPGNFSYSSLNFFKRSKSWMNKI